MNQERIKRAQLLEQMTGGERTLKEIAVVLNLSYRHAKRLKAAS